MPSGCLVSSNPSRRSWRSRRTTRSQRSSRAPPRAPQGVRPHGLRGPPAQRGPGSPPAGHEAPLGGWRARGRVPQHPGGALVRRDAHAEDRQREVPIARTLAGLIGEVEKGARGKDTWPSRSYGEPWGHTGSTRVRADPESRRPGRLVRLRAPALRDHELAPQGIPVHVVQKMAGHKNLSTTEHYVHFLKTDLEDAARRLNEPGVFPDLGGRGNSGETALRAS